MDFSLVESVFETLRISPPSKLILLEAPTFSSAHVPPFPPDIPALIIGLDSRELTLQVKNVLLATYPKEHEVFLLNLNTKIQSIKEKNVVSLSLVDLADEKNLDQYFSQTTCLYLPSIG